MAFKKARGFGYLAIWLFGREPCNLFYSYDLYRGIRPNPVVLSSLKADGHAWPQSESSATAVNPLLFGSTKADQGVGKPRLDPNFPGSSQRR